MLKPKLIVIGGCNGSGKSSFSNDIVNSNKPFDYDKEFLKFYHSIGEFELRDRMAHNMARELLEKEIATAIKNKTDFSYETNFNSTPLFWPQKFKEAGFEIHLVFLCLDSIEKAIERVDIRVENGGHFVPEDEIISRYHDGYENLEMNFNYFDSIFLFDTSEYKKSPSPVIYFEKELAYSLAMIPKFISQKLPQLTNHFEQLHP